ncbi:MAG: TonB-dependent receptor domain-containing protein [Spirosomataceae bacterium]
MKYLPLLFLLLISSASASFAQRFKVSGILVDEKKQPVIGAHITLTNTATNKMDGYAVTDIKGAFSISRMLPQRYLFKATFIGYEDFLAKVDLSANKDLNMDTLQFQVSSTQLTEVEVKARMATAVQKGDTLQFNAGAFKVHADAVAGDLLSKIPGITNENGVVKANGETIREILVDGKQFFGDDVSIALKNLPAEILDKIEIYDKQSEQSQFTGFNDGNTSKTINLVTRQDRRNGKFGRASAGYGTDGTYSSNLNYNQFKGNRRISVIGMSNNINQQNFGMQDVGGGAGNNRGGGASFGQSSGINTSNALGLNYTDNLGKKVTVRGSYFFNKTATDNYRTSQRQYFLTNGTNQFYKDTTSSGSVNFNHRFNLRLEYTIDAKNSILFTPRLSWQTTNSGSATMNQNTIADALLNKSRNSSGSNSNSYNYSNTLLYRHKFAKKGRTVSLELGSTITNRESFSSLYSLNSFYGTTNTQRITNQKTASPTNSYQLSSNLTYSEPIGTKSMLQLSYNVGYNNNQSTRTVNKFNATAETYDILDSLLSNKFDNDYITNRFGASYNILAGDKLRLMTNLSYQIADLRGQQLFPKTNSTNRVFTNLMPMLMLDYKLTAEKKLRLTYRTTTQAPSITQLQNVVNNSNPLVLSAGNPNLQQEFGHSLSTRYTYTNPLKATSFVAVLSGDYTLHPIGSATYIAEQATTIDGIDLGKGAQLTRPVNLENSLSSRLFLTAGIPVKSLKSNVNLNTGLGYTRSPGLINNQVNFSNNSSLSQGIIIGSNISEKIDFTVSYTFNYNNVENSLRPQLNNKYYNQTVALRGNFVLGKGFVYQTDLNYQAYTGLAASFNQEFTLWNMSLAKKMLKKQAGELKLTVFDLLKQNTSIVRNTTASYLEDVNSLVLKQYFMLTFTYSLRAFGMPNNNRPRNNNNGFDSPEDGGRQRGGGFGGGNGGGFGGGGFGGGRDN